jgi:hypothetical protein
MGDLEKVVKYYNDTKAIYSEYYVHKNTHKKEGLVKIYYRDGAIGNEINYKNGKEEGSFKSYYSNGNMNEEGTIKKEMLYGNHKLYHPNGKICCEKEYDESGTFKINTLLDEKGRDCMLPEGDIIVYKAGGIYNESKSNPINVYIKILVPSSARRMSTVRRDRVIKSRIEYGHVLEIVDEFGVGYRQARNIVHTLIPTFYTVGEKIVPDGFDDDPEKDCAKGIHVHSHKDHCKYWFHS